MSKVNLILEARKCEILARDYRGRPEQTLLLNIAREFRYMDGRKA